MPFSSSVRSDILNFYFGAAPAITKPASLLLSLHSADPGLTGAGELSGGGYARQAVTFGPEADGVVKTVAEVEFSDLPASTIGWVGVWAAAGGFLFGASLGQAKTVGAGDFFRVPANGTISLQ